MMPTLTMGYTGERGLFDMALAIESVSNIRIMSASICGDKATFYYITLEPIETDIDPYSCIHAADDCE